MFVPALAQTHLLGNDASGAAGKAPWLTLHEVQVKLEAMGYRDIDEITSTMR